VLGHSVGECTAACVAGVLSLEDALRLSVVRGRLAEAARGGAMAAVFAGADEYGAEVAVAARNAPGETVITGEREAVAKVLAELAARGIRSRSLSMDYAFHSQSLDPVLDELEREAATLTYRQPALELISCLTGQRGTAGDFASPTYWRRQAREPVQFAAGLRAAQASGCRIFLEIGPGAALTSLGQRNDESALWLPSLRQDRGEFARMLESLARLYEAGAPVDWAGFDKGYSRRRVAVPTYPFQRQRFWIRQKPTSVAAPQQGALLGRPLSSPAMESRAWESLIGAGWPGFLDDHRIAGTPIMPAAAFATQALLAAGNRNVELSDFTVSEALIVGEQEQKSVQVILAADGSVQIHSRAAERWTLHASGKLREPAAATPDPEPAGTIQNRCPESIAGDEFYANALRRQMQFGPVFRQIDRLWRGGGEALCRLAATAADREARIVGLIDACFQLAASARPIDDSTSIVVPTGFERLRLHGAPSGELWGHATAEGKALVFGEAGVVLEIEGIRLRPAPIELLQPVTAGNCLYQASWQPAPSPAVPAPDGQWLIVADDTGVAAALKALMESRGADCFVAQHPGQIGPGDWRGVIDLSALNVTRPEDAGACEGTLGTYQTLTAAGVRAPVWLVTAGGQFVESAPTPVLPSHAALWGLGRSVAMERPELRGGLIDLDPGVPAGDSAAAVMQEILAADPEPEVVIRGGSRHVARMVACKDGDTSDTLRLRPDATYLITGGVGGLGLLVARRFAARGARHLVLLSRNEPGSSAQAAIDELRDQGVHVTTVKADVAREHDLTEALGHISPPLAGIVHAAGVLDDALLPQQTWTKFEAVMAPKVAGSWNLHVHTRNLPLDFLVMFSSLSGALGAPAQSNYAAANAFVDALAHHRRAQGLPALSINWAPWSDVGMAASARGWTARGLSAVPPERGLDLLERMLQQPSARAQVAVIPADWPQFLAQFPDDRSTRIFSSLHSEDVLRRPDFRRQLEAAPAARRHELLVAHVREQVIAVLDPDASGELTVSRGFFDLGMDSLMAMEVRNRLQRSVGIALPATVAFEQGSIAALADHLSGVLFPREAVETAAAAPDDEALAALLTEIEALSPDDVERQLTERQGGAGTP
jgi:acyl transferase domain-containing protein